MCCLYPLILTAAVVVTGLTSCNGQKASDQSIKQRNTASLQTAERVGGPCETCELIYVGIPDNIDETDTSEAWNEDGQKLKITGTVYRQDGKTPAPDVILYYWQTNSQGEYASKETLAPAASRHGYIRGWVKTDDQGRYTIHTIRPGSYPNSRNPAHVHFLVREPDIQNEYYIDDILFDDDPLLTDEIRNQLDDKGGSGVVKVYHENGFQTVMRNIILGQNITNYPGIK